MNLSAAPLVYFARAVDGLVRDEIVAEADALAAELDVAGLRLVDPVAAWWNATAHRTSTATDEDLVSSDLGLLRRADGLLMDLSMPMRDYVGCICELTYAHLWRIPSVIWVGDTGLEQRVWLRSDRRGRRARHIRPSPPRRGRRRRTSGGSRRARQGRRRCASRWEARTAAHPTSGWSGRDA